MASISNHERPSKNATIWNGEDRISSLPDSLLVHILSFLPTKYAVGTSTLSPRWKHMWASIPNLDFDDELLFNPKRGCADEFMRFVDRVLLLHNLPCIQRFCLKGGTNIDLYRLDTWINVAISRSVEELDIQISTDQYIILPTKLFNSETLVIFKLKLLSQIELFYIPHSVSFPSLKIFHVLLHCPDDQLIETFFQIFPVLEDLFIEAYMRNYLERIFRIHAPALKSCKINFFRCDDLEYSVNVIILNAPKLEYLSLQDDYLAYYSLENLSSLVKADVNVGHCCIRTLATKEYASPVFEVMKGIYNVKSLSLGARTMGALDFADDDNKLHFFPNLTHLEVGVNICYGWKRLPDLLNSMPNLVNLVLKKNLDHGDDDFHKEFNWIEPQAVPICLLLHLKEIIFTGIKGQKDDLELIEYFLKNAAVLNKMTIRSCKLGSKEERKFLKNLVVFRRGSKNCQIELS